MSRVGSDSKALSSAPRSARALGTESEKLMPRTRQGSPRRDLVHYFPDRMKEEVVGLFLQTTACCNQRGGKAEIFNSYFASMFSIKGNKPTIGKGKTKVVYRRIMGRAGQS